jgi:hypothetical protein
MYELFVAVRQRGRAGGRGGQWVDIGAAGSVELYMSVVFYLFCFALSVEFYMSVVFYLFCFALSVEFYRDTAVSAELIWSPPDR